MHTLIITAHPSSQGFTHQIAKAYSSGAQKKGNTVEILDLYSPEFAQDFLRFKSQREIPASVSPIRTKIQEKIRAADELVFIHPLWWYDMPAILKNWIDTNFTSGFAFRFTPKTRYLPERLLKKKTARVFITADGPGFFYAFLSPFRLMWRLTLWYCGIKVRGIYLLSSKRKRSPEYLSTWLQKVEKIAER